MSKTKSIRKEEGYLSNREFVEELINCQEQQKISDDLGKMFMLLSDKTSTHRFFVRYPFREDLVSEGVLACCRAYDKFDATRVPEGSDIANAHAFFTTIIFNAYRALLKKEYDQKNIKDKMKVNNDMDPSFGYNDTFDEDKKREEDEYNGNFEEYQSGSICSKSI